MSDYNYKEGKKRLFNILDNKTTVVEKESVPADSAFNFENGIKAPVASIFVDIRNSTDYFKNNPRDRVARTIRAFVSEIIKILRSDDNFRDLGIRGDCVFAVYSASSSKEINSIFNCATLVNTFIEMINKGLSDKKWPELQIGIGLGYDANELVIKTGEKGSGFNDFVWIGNAVVDASNCCGIANKGTFKPIVVSSFFYEKIKNEKANKDFNYDHYFKKLYSSDCKGYVYHANLVNTDFNEWIKKGMKQ